MLFSCDVACSLVLLRTTASSWIAWRGACTFFPLSSSAPLVAGFGRPWYSACGLSCSVAWDAISHDTIFANVERV